MTLAPLATAELGQIKAIAVDIDGTLTLNGRFSSQLFTTLERLQVIEIPVLLVTGRSAGWVESLANYLPVTGVIGENGGCYVSRDIRCQLLGGIKPKELTAHREKLADCFWQLQGSYAQLQESPDNRWRLTDWTFDLDKLSASDLWEIGAQCERWSWDFTYSNIQCHIKLPTQSKASGIRQVAKKYLSGFFSGIQPQQILTIGDSPNDSAMFDPEEFPASVGVANIQEYADRLTHQPAYIAANPEVTGFIEIVDALFVAKAKAPKPTSIDILPNIFQ
jgi:hydroxymethylpyrimidine pyrophosphatase-like HAD family hydrolase